MKTLRIFGLACIALFVTQLLKADTLNVPGDYAVIQDAVDAAQTGDIILIAPGTYSGSGNNEISLSGKEITIAGSGISDTIIDCENTARGFVFSDNETRLTVLENLKIINGMRADDSGGAVVVSDASPSIMSVAFETCSAKNGGAVAIGGIASPLIRNCRFIANRASQGGAIWCSSESTPEISGQTIADGNYFQENFAGAGSDLFCDSEPVPSVDARYNEFAGLPNSDYYVSPVNGFDLTGSISQISPITQDVYVRTNGSNSNDGLSWATAFATIQYALAHVMGTANHPVTIHVGIGDFSATNTGEEFPLPLMDYVSIVGDSYSSTEIDAESNARIFYGYSDSELAVSDMTVRNGYSDSGGGAYLSLCEIELENLRFWGNEAEVGGALYLINDSSTFTSCHISGSSATYSGGVYNAGTDNLFTECIFADNEAEFSGGSITAIYGTVRLMDCLIEESVAASGAGLEAGTLSSIFVEGCEFDNNWAYQNGGGIYVREDASLFVYNSALTVNYARFKGGGIMIEDPFGTIEIGGSPENGNLFEDNISAAGADLMCNTTDGDVIEATHNDFKGYPHSDYYVSPGEMFDLSHFSFTQQPVTQNVYVSPDGDNSSDGLTPGTAWQSIEYAMSRIYTDEFNPLTVYLTGGSYSARDDETFPIPMMDHINLVAVGLTASILDPDYDETGLYFCFDTDITVSNISIHHGSGRQGGAIHCEDSDPLIALSSFSTCSSEFNGGAIHISRNAQPKIVSCIFDNNSTDDSGGAISVDSSTPLITNCLFLLNDATWYGGAVYCFNSFFDITGCTVTGNTAGQEGSGLYHENAQPSVTSCIFWDNSTDSIAGLTQLPDVTYCDIQGGYPGTGNIAEDPRFETLYQLENTSSGGTVDSPCIDAGHTSASSVCFSIPNGSACLDQFTTMTNETPDSGQVDMGFHRRISSFSTPTPAPTATVTVTPTITPTPTVTPTPSMTPVPTDTPPPTVTPTSTPEIPPTFTNTPVMTSTATSTATPLETPVPYLGVELELSHEIFHPGEQFLFTAAVYNPGPDIYSSIPMAVLLDVYGDYFWYPGWTRNFETDYIDVDIGVKMISILDFTWPDVSGSAAGIRFYGALLTPSLNAILGEFDTVSFGWEE